MSDKDTMRNTVHQVTEEIQVAGRELISTLKTLLQDASVHRIRVFNTKTNELVVDIPAIAGAGGALLFAPLAPLMLLGVVALYLMDFTIVIERQSEPVVEHIEIEVESLDSAAPAVDEIVVEGDVVVSVVTNEPVEIEIITEASDEADDEPTDVEIEIVTEASDAADDNPADIEIEIAAEASDEADDEPADSVVESQDESAGEPVEADEPAEIEIVIEPAAEPTPAPDEVTQCQGITKSGSQCKRKPMEGSAYCYMHHPD